jgi:succinate-acetate transporter protein
MGSKHLSWDLPCCFFGGLLQIIAGLSEAVRVNNIFGYTAFLLFGEFWMSLAIVDIEQLMASGDATPPNPYAVQAMLFLTEVFSSYSTVDMHLQDEQDAELSVFPFGDNALFAMCRGSK